jgi:hypothetical protein
MVLFLVPGFELQFGSAFFGLAARGYRGGTRGFSGADDREGSIPSASTAVSRWERLCGVPRRALVPSVFRERVVLDESGCHQIPRRAEMVSPSFSTVTKSVKEGI